mgnify:CR=1 FL=1
MQIAQQHIQAINTLMLAEMQSYIKCYATADSDVSSLQMYADDIAYNSKILAAFNNSNLRKKDLLNLHTAIIKQDTLVREHFYNVLKYIEDNVLIDKQYFACI